MTFTALKAGDKVAVYCREYVGRERTLVFYFCFIDTIEKVTRKQINATCGKFERETGEGIGEQALHFLRLPTDVDFQLQDRLEKLREEKRWMLR